MSKLNSTATAFDLLKMKYVPQWRLDTNTMTITHFNPDTLTEESKTYHTDFIKYHLHYSDGKSLIGFVGSSMRERSFNTSMSWH